MPRAVSAEENKYPEVSSTYGVSVTSEENGPAEEYRRRLDARRLEIRCFDKLHIRYGNVRLLLAVVIAALAWCALRLHLISPWWLAVPVAAFAVVAVYHARVLRARGCALRVVEVYQRGLARIEDRWMGGGQQGERFRGLGHGDFSCSERKSALSPGARNFAVSGKPQGPSPAAQDDKLFVEEDVNEVDAVHRAPGQRESGHIYAADLDLFGAGSLFELLSTARTRMGENALAAWLLSPAPVEEILGRQGAVAELRGNLDLREDLAVLGKEAGAGVHPEALLRWAEAPVEVRQRWLRWLAPVLALLAIGTAVVWAVGGMFLPFLIVLIVEGSISYGMRKRLDAVLSATEGAFENLDLLSTLLARLEREEFRAPRLQAIEQALASHNQKGSQAIARLRTLVDFIDSRDNLFVKVLDAPLMYFVQAALASEDWRARHGRAVRGWLTATGEMEAMLSLAAYHYEHPGDPFPEFLAESSDGVPILHGEGLGHPLLPAAQCVRNDVRLDAETRVLLVSGSNMSGKSTYLRTAGINAVMAMAGAPVRARRLRLTPLQVGASIQVNDSLQEGSSRFYAEITRLRRIYDLAAKRLPLLFLLDELLQGTNSNDRRIGAEGVLRGLVERGAVGILTTHDLALTEMGGLQQGVLRNMHFQDDLEEGRMRFDFLLREGIITKSNGLELMRSIGLKV